VASAAVTAAVSPASAEEERIRVKIEGYLDQWAVAARQDVDTGDGTDVDTSPFDQKHNAEIYFAGEVTLDAELTIGFAVELEANSSDNQIDQSYLYLEHPRWGGIQIGDVDNVAVALGIVAPDGGVAINDGDLVEIEAFVLPEGFEATNTLIDTTFLQLGDDASGKFNYFTPRVGGIQVGISYIPQFEAGGDDNDSIARIGNDGPVRDGFALGLNFSREVAETGLEAYAGYIVGDTPAAAGSSDVQGAGAGLVLAIADVEVGGSVAWADGDTPGDTAVDGFAFDIGAAYGVGPYTVGITYIRGVTEGSRADGHDQRLDQVVLSGSYVLGPGVAVVAGLFYFDADGERGTVAGTDGVASSEGFGLASGLKLTF
jgi:hypothetical protein